jgi:hypothetical protein
MNQPKPPYNNAIKRMTEIFNYLLHYNDISTYPTNDESEELKCLYGLTSTSKQIMDEFCKMGKTSQNQSIEKYQN